MSDDPEPIRVPFLRRTQIRREAAMLLGEYGARFAPVIEPPVPVEEILEVHLGLSLEITDLRELYGFGDVLGAIWFAERTVRIDAGLDPHRHPGMLGRYRYTQAHEGGHWRQHRRFFLRNDAAAANHRPAYVCRSSQAKHRIEWQADYFAAQLLMPSNLLRAAWEDWHGSPRPAGPAELSSSEDLATAAHRFVRPLADRFEVSAEAMRIRLDELGLLQLQEPAAIQL